VPRPSRPGCGAATGEAAQARAQNPVTVTAGNSLNIPFDSFQTTSEDVFSTQPGPNTAGDTSLQIALDGYLFVAMAVGWTAGAYNRRAWLNAGQFNYIDLLHGIWTGVEGPELSPLDSSAMWCLDFRTGAYAAGTDFVMTAENFDAADHDVTYAQLNMVWFPMTAPPATVY